jgi:hypothetical protein
MKNLYFLSGLPRSGSTLLGTLLSQRDDMFVSATSGLIDIMGSTVHSWEESPEAKNGEPITTLYDMLGGLIHSKYKNTSEQVIIDKNRGWPAPPIMDTMGNVLGQQPKIIATVRPIAECLASFVKISKYTGDIKEFIKSSPLANHLFMSYSTLKEGWKSNPENFLFVEYKDIIEQPQNVCDKISDFLNIDRFVHKLDGLSNPVPENDAEIWGIPDLHYVRPTISKAEYSHKEILGKKIWDYYQGGEFWNDVPEPVYEKTILDQQLEASLSGNFELGWELCKMAAEDDDRAQFNKGWYVLRNGDLQGGMALLDRGRIEGIFGSDCASSRPQWKGEPLYGKTILLNLEGGLGDQICNARWATDLAKKGAKVVLAGSPDLASVLINIEGVSAFVETTAIGGVWHDYWAPSMSVVRQFGYNYKNIKGVPYIKYSNIFKNEKFKVGIRWAGNPMFEHQQLRRFEPSYLFNLSNVDLVSLQRDDNTIIPEHISTPSLNTWDETCNVIAKLDMVITSCTSVAHMSAAMGKPTWIIVPILPYYLWALPGEKTPWYKSVRLFRQTKSGEWDDVFEKINTELSKILLN